MQQKCCGDGVMERLVPTWSIAIVNQLISKSSVIVETAMFSCSGFAFLNLHLLLTDQGLSVTD